MQLVAQMIYDKSVLKRMSLNQFSSNMAARNKFDNNWLMNGVLSVSVDN